MAEARSLSSQKRPPASEQLREQLRACQVALRTATAEAMRFKTALDSLRGERDALKSQLNSQHEALVAAQSNAKAWGASDCLQHGATVLHWTGSALGIPCPLCTLHSAHADLQVKYTAAAESAVRLYEAGQPLWWRAVKACFPGSTAAKGD